MVRICPAPWTQRSAAGVVGAMPWRSLPAAVPAFAMAPIVYGKSEEHLHFPGTVTL